MITPPVMAPNIRKVDSWKSLKEMKKLEEKNQTKIDRFCPNPDTQDQRDRAGRARAAKADASASRNRTPARLAKDVKVGDEDAQIVVKKAISGGTMGEIMTGTRRRKRTATDFENYRDRTNARIKELEQLIDKEQLRDLRSDRDKKQSQDQIKKWKN